MPLFIFSYSSIKQNAIIAGSQLTKSNHEPNKYGIKIIIVPAVTVANDRKYFLSLIYDLSFKYEMYVFLGISITSCDMKLYSFNSINR